MNAPRIAPMVISNATMMKLGDRRTRFANADAYACG